MASEIEDTIENAVVKTEKEPLVILRPKKISMVEILLL